MSIAALMWPYIERNVDALVSMLEQADERARQWKPAAAGANSLAALVNHTVSNLEDNVLGAILGDEVVYARQADFDAPELDATIVRSRWRSVRAPLDARLGELTDSTLLETVEHPRRGSVTKFETLLVVARHTAEHLAHAELTRDLYQAAHPKQ